MSVPGTMRRTTTILRPIEEENEPQTDEGIPDDMLEATSLKNQDWHHAQHQDQPISCIISCIDMDRRPDAKQVAAFNVDRRYLREWEALFVRDGILYRKADVNGQECEQLVLPTALRDVVFRAYHDDLGHQGRDRSISLIKRRFFFPGLDTYVEKMVRKCGSCIRRKTAPTKAAPLVPITSSSPMELVCIDYLSLETSKGGL